jgi:hypothetical protein
MIGARRVMCQPRLSVDHSAGPARPRRPPGRGARKGRRTRPPSEPPRGRTAGPARPRQAPPGPARPRQQMVRLRSPPEPDLPPESFRRCFRPCGTTATIHAGPSGNRTQGDVFQGPADPPQGNRSPFIRADAAFRSALRPPGPITAPVSADVPSRGGRSADFLRWFRLGGTIARIVLAEETSGRART